MVAAAKAEEANVVIVGFWNPAILQPPWLAEHAFGGDAAKQPVQAEFSLVAGQPPRFTIRGIRVLPDFGRLTVQPAGLEPGELTEAERIVRNILESLPHTPVSAFGVNYVFEEREPSEAVLGLFADQDGLAEASRLEFETASTTVSRALQMGDCVLNFSRTLAAENLVTYKFNFHYKVDGAKAARELLEGALARNFETSKIIVMTYDRRE